MASRFDFLIYSVSATGTVNEGSTQAVELHPLDTRRKPLPREAVTFTFSVPHPFDLGFGFGTRFGARSEWTARGWICKASKGFAIPKLSIERTDLEDELFGSAGIRALAEEVPAHGDVDEEVALTRRVLQDVPLQRIHDAAHFFTAHPEQVWEAGASRDWITRFLVGHDPSLGVALADSRTQHATFRTGRPRRSDEQLQRVAEAWLWAASKGPGASERAANRLGMKVGTFRSQKTAAVTEGFLMAGPSGRVVAQPGPNFKSKGSKK